MAANEPQTIMSDLPTPVPEPIPAPSPAPASKAAIFVRRLSSTLALWAVVTTGMVTGNPALLFALVAGASLLCLWEFLKMMGPLPAGARRWTLVCGVLFWAVPGAFWMRGVLDPIFLDGLLLAVLLLGLFTRVLARPLEGRETLWRLFVPLAGYVYTVVLAGFFLRLMVLGQPVEGKLPGLFYVLYVVAVTKFTDMGAYAIGSLIGKHKMIPHISPGKTWEGFGGALLGAFIASHGVVALFGSKVPLLNHGHAAVLAVILALVTIVADLAESVLKRCAGVKDSGNFLPGIGGGLDLMDSLLFTAPVAWFYLMHVV